MSRYSGESWSVRVRRRLTRRRLAVLASWVVAIVGLYLLSPMLGVLALIGLVLSLGMLMVPG